MKKQMKKLVGFVLGADGVRAWPMLVAMVVALAVAPAAQAYDPPPDIVIATGDFSDIANKDTFTITNAASGAAATVTAGGICKVAGQFWSLDVSEDGQLSLSALDPVKLTNVFIIDETTGKTNATAVVKAGGNTFEPEADGSFEVPANYPLDVVYEAAGYGEEDGNMFGPGWQYKTLSLPNGISGNTSLDDPEYADLKEQVAAQCQAQWVDGDGEAGGREIALDTRERIVVASPNDVLPIAYSTNYWGAVEGAETVDLMVYYSDWRYIAENATENGYGEWMPELGAYGAYELTQDWYWWPNANDPEPIATSNAYIYYSQPYPLTWVTPEHGTLAVTNAGEAVASGDQVLGYDWVNLAAAVEPHYEFKGWSVVTNGVTFTDAFTNAATLVTRLEMPNADTELKADIAWQSTFTEAKTVDEGETWEVFAGDDYQKGLENFGTVVWKPGVTNEQGKASGLDKFSQLHNVENGKMQIAFDETLTNGTYKIAGDAANAVGQTFQITNGGQTNDCTVVEESALETTDWTYVGAKRFKLYVDGNGDLQLIVEPRIPMAIVFEQPEGGAIAALTNDSPIVSGTKLYPGEKVALKFTPADHWQADTNTLQLVDATNKVYDVTYFADVTLSGASFKMTETNATLSMAFTISDAYRAALFEAATNNYVATTNAIEELRDNRLTGEETDAALKDASSALDAAAGSLAAAYKPSEGDTATNALAVALDKVEQDATAVSDSKPWTITVDANALANGTNVFNTIDAAFAATDFLPYATNLVVIGEQRAFTPMPKMMYAWNLIVRNWQSEETFDATKSPYQQTRLAFEAAAQTDVLTNLLAAVAGEGRILLANDGREEEAAAFEQALRDRVAGEPAAATVQVIATEHARYLEKADLDGEYVAIDMLDVTNCAITNWTAFAAPQVSNSGTLVWAIGDGNRDAKLADFDIIVNGDSGTFGFDVAAQPATGDYVLAERASSAADLEFQCKDSAGTFTVTVNGDMTVRPMNERIYWLKTNEANELVLTVSDMRTHFVSSKYEVVEGGAVKVYVWGGSPENAVQAVLSYVEGSGKFESAWMNGEEVSFPLRLSWDKGEIVAKEILFRTAKDKTVKYDRSFTLQLAEGGGEDALVGCDVCTVTIRDTEGGEEPGYVRALAYPANGGKVTGGGVVEEGKRVRIEAKAKGGSIFAGWYRAMKDDPNTINLEDCIGMETVRNIKNAGTYFAYFTNVVSVATVIDPDPSEGTGVVFDEELGAYEVMVGVKTEFPVTFTVDEGDESGKLTVSGLPAGLTFADGVVSGVPTVAGAFTMKIIAKNNAGRNVRYYSLVSVPLPTCAVGTWSGVIRDNAFAAGIGAVTFTAGSTGKLSAKVTTQYAADTSFAVTGYDRIDDETLGVCMETEDGETFEAELNLAADWNERQLSGRVEVSGEDVDETGDFEIVRNPYNSKTGTEEARQELVAYKGEYGAVQTMEGSEKGNAYFKVSKGGKTIVVADVEGKEFIGTVPAGLKVVYDDASDANVGLVECALRNGHYIWGADSYLNKSDRTTWGFSRYLSYRGKDWELVIGEEPAE